MSCVARRTRNQRNERLMEMYREMKSGQGSSGTKKGKPIKSAPSQSSNHDKENEVEENHVKGNKGVKAEHTETEYGDIRAEDKDINGIDEGSKSSSDKMVVSSDDSDEEMSSDSSSSDTDNSDDKDFNIPEDSDEEKIHSLTNTDSSSSETDDVDEDDVLVTGKNGRYDEAGVQGINSEGIIEEEEDDDVIVIGDDDDDTDDNVPVIDKDVRKETRKRSTSNSKYGKEAEDRSSKKLKKIHCDWEIVKIVKGPVKKLIYEEDRDTEDRDYEGRRHVDAESSKIRDNGAGKKHIEKKTRGRKKSKRANRELVLNILKDRIDEATKQATEPSMVPPSLNITLPLKFRFEDDEETEPEKSEIDKEADELFAEMDLNSLDFGPHSHMSDAKTNGSTICSEEGHDTYLNEEIGLICHRCNKVVTEIKYITPDFGKDPQDASSERRRYIAGEDSALDTFDFRGTEDNGQDLQSQSYGTVWSLIPSIRKSMYPHQQEGFEFLWKNMAGTIKLDELKGDCAKPRGGCIISHKPGTGKTRLTITFLQAYLKLFPQCLPVIIAPYRILPTWEGEFKKWNCDFPFHNLNNPEFSGKEIDYFLRAVPSNKCQDAKVMRLVKLGSWTKGKSVLGISYNLYEKIVKDDRKEKGFGRDQDVQLRNILLRCGLVVLDEGHTPRNKRGRIYKSCLKLKTERRIILSGTPFQNNFDELFSTLELVRPSLAASLGNPSSYASDDKINRLKAAMSDFVHVHRGSILQELPGLTDCIIVLNPPELQKKLIAGIRQLKGTLDSKYKEAMVSVHPCLCKDKGFLEKDALDKLRLDYNEGVKTKFTIALIRLSLSKKEKVLIFSQFIEPLNLIRDQLREHFGYGCNEVLQIQGDIDQKSRTIMIDRFNDPDSSAKVMLASTKCCSEGISLVGASRVVLLDVAWNPSVESQAISRAFRLGQNRMVYTYHLMTSGTTEVRKYRTQAEKDRWSEVMFAPKNSEKRWMIPARISDDVILETMMENVMLKGMFEKIIHQPKEKNLLQCFGIPSYSAQF